MSRTQKKPSQFSPLSLAYIGDGVYDLYVRTRVMEEHEDMPPSKLHRITAEHVKAKSQARSISNMIDRLTEEETAVYKRGRNAKSYTMPKNAQVSDYRKATGLEALFGFLYLSGMDERLGELMKTAYETATDINTDNGV